MKIGPPLIEISIEPVSAADRQGLGRALQEFAARDPSFRFSVDAESGRTTLVGASEADLAVEIETLRRFGEFEIGAPQILYRETLARPVEITYTHRKKFGAGAQFATVTIRLQPTKPGDGSTFESSIVDLSAPKEFGAAVENGVRGVMNSGILAGFPVVDVKATLIDWACHGPESSALALETAARAAFREGLRKGGPLLLEPIVRVELAIPSDLGDVPTADLLARGGRVVEQRDIGGGVEIAALAPLANMLGYRRSLASATRGRASATLEFSHFAPVPSPDDDGTFPPAVGMRA